MIIETKEDTHYVFMRWTETKEDTHYVFMLWTETKEDTHYVFMLWTETFDTITNNYEVIYVIKTVMKYHLQKIDTSFHQPLPNMVQRLFADVINDAIWFIYVFMLWTETKEDTHYVFMLWTETKEDT
jgi:hypothetical protein